MVDMFLWSITVISGRHFTEIEFSAEQSRIGMKIQKYVMRSIGFAKEGASHDLPCMQ